MTDSFTTANRFVFGNNTLLRATHSSQVTLTYSGSGTMFTGTDVSWTVTTISLSCTSGTLFSATSTTGAHTFALLNTTIIACTTLGTVDKMLAVVIDGNIFVSISADGITFLNNVSLFSYVSSLATIAAGDLFDLGTATFDSFKYSSAFTTVNGAANLLRGATGSANINTGGLGTLLDTRSAGTGTTLVGITTDDALWQFLLNDAILDSRADSLAVNTAGTTVTISVINTPVKIAGTFIDKRSSQFTNTTSGRATYDGGKEVILPITVAVNVEPASGTNKSFTVYVAINGTVVEDSGILGHGDSGSSVNVTIPWQDSLSTTDFVEIFIENNTDTIDLVVNNAVLRIN